MNNQNSLETRIYRDRMGFYFKCIGYQKANTTSTSRVTWLVVNGIVRGQISEIIIILYYYL